MNDSRKEVGYCFFFLGLILTHTDTQAHTHAHAHTHTHTHTDTHTHARAHTHTCLTVLCDLHLLSLWHLGNVQLTLWDLRDTEEGCETAEVKTITQM